MAQAPGTVDPWAWVPPEWGGAPAAPVAGAEQWPPAEWGTPILPAPTDAPPEGVTLGEPTVQPDPAGDAAKARAFANALFDDTETEDGEEKAGGVRLGFPTNPDERPLTPEEEALIGPGLEDEPGDVVAPTGGQAYKVGGEPLDPYATSDELIDPYGPDLDFATDDEAQAGEQDARIAELAELDPEAYAQIVASKQIKAEAERATREAELAQKQREAIESSEARRQTARTAATLELEKIKGEATALADGTPFAQWWSTRSTGQKVAGYVAAMLGGFLQSQTGGRNSAIDFMMKLADDEANAKWAALRERKGLALESQTQADQDFSSREAVRLATYEQMARQLESELATLDPQGTAAIKIAGAVREVRAKTAAAMAAAEGELFNRADKMIAREQEQQKIEIEAAKADAQIAATQAKIARIGAGAGSAKLGKQKWTSDQLAQMFPGAPVPTDGLDRTIGEYGTWLETSKKGKELADPSKREVEGRELAYKVNDEVFQAPTKEVATEARVKIAATREVIDMIDEIDSIRERYGGETDLFNSEGRQALEVLAPRILKLEKSSTQGMSSDEDMNTIKAAAGADDVASFRSQAAKLKVARRRMTSELNGWLEDVALYQGKPIKFGNRWTRPPASTADQKELETLVGSKQGEKGQTIPTAAIAVNPIVAGPARLIESAVRSESIDLGKGPERELLQKRVQAAMGDDKEKARGAVADLREAAEKSRSPAVSNAAKNLLRALKVLGKAPEPGEEDDE